MNVEDLELQNILLDEGIINVEQVAALDEEFKRNGKSLSDLLIDYEILTKKQLKDVIAVSLGTEVLNIEKFEIDKPVIDLLNSMQARMYGALPLGYDDSGNLKVVLSNPLNDSIVEDLGFIVGKQLKIYLSYHGQFDAAMEKYYPVDSISDTVEDIGIDVSEKDVEDIGTAEIADLANNASIIKFLNIILYQAIKDQASDIHFEPFEKSFKIRYRVDGVLYEMEPPPKELATPVISRIKIMSGLNIAERRLPQDGRIQLKILGKNIDLRVSTIPTHYGESVVLRILDKSIVNLDLESLGIDREVLKLIREIVHLPNGFFIVTGPTGSGKTTTLYSCLKEVNKVADKILTAEDPVEYDLEGIIQLPINNAVDMTFAGALRAFLRQDPDIIMIGEIRDLDTAQMALQASLTGHFVLSTLHTKEAADAITRLIDMGVMPYLLNSALIGIIGQRLVRRICTSCKTVYTPKKEELKKLNLDEETIGNIKFYYGKGCSFCNDTGYKGRKAIVELLKITPEISELITKLSPTITIRKKAIEQGMVTVRDDGIRSILNGETTLEEILKCCT